MASRIGKAAMPTTCAMCLPAARATIICAIGASNPPLMPWRIRKAISEFADHASPHRVEERVKAAKHQR